jgi:uncharacterized protein with PIN domain
MATHRTSKRKQLQRKDDPYSNHHVLFVTVDLMKVGEVEEREVRCPECNKTFSKKLAPYMGEPRLVKLP